MPYSETALAAYREMSQRLLRLPFFGPIVFDVLNVHAVGVGRKIVQGRRTGQESIQVHVLRKLPLAVLTLAEIIPREIFGIPTDVIETPLAVGVIGVGAGPNTTQRRTRVRPIFPGVSAGHQGGGTGTLGAFCRSTHAGSDPAAVYVLSNNHVFANLNQAAPGDALVQPGGVDLGAIPADTFAVLDRAVPIVAGPTANNRVDAALGRLVPGTPILNQICNIGVLSGATQAEEDLPVRKHGRTTGLTEGTVTNELIDAFVALNPAMPRTLTRFLGQIRIEPTAAFPFIAGGGDSGSLVVTGDPARAVGLLFAAAPDGSFGYANQIQDVLTSLEVELL